MKKLGFLSIFVFAVTAIVLADNFTVVSVTISRTDTSAASRATAQVGTASARASVSVADVQITVNFTVVSVTGRVEKESGNQRIDVRVDEVLDGNVIIHTGVGASVVLRDESGKSVTVAAARNGSVSELTRAAAPSIRVGGSISRTDTSAASRATASIGTASARASVSVVDVQTAIAGCNCVSCDGDGDCDDGCNGSCKGTE